MRFIAQAEHRIARIDAALDAHAGQGDDDATGHRNVPISASGSDGDSLSSEEVAEGGGGIDSPHDHTVISAYATSSWADGRAFLLGRAREQLSKWLQACRKELLPLARKHTRA
jgi:hypothetical protein